MTTPSRTQAEQALAALIHSLRPDWQTPGILAQIRLKPQAPLLQVAAAAVYAATRRDQHSPHLIGQDDGAALDALLGKTAGPPAPQPVRGCPTHPGQPFDCPDCAAYRRNAITDPQRIAAIRAAHRKEADA